MMKKTVSLLMALLIVLCSFFLVGCEDHDHEYVENASIEYLASSADCSSPAKYYKSCKICSEKSEQTFEVGRKLHRYNDRFCAYCGEQKPLYYTYTDEEYRTYFEFGEYPQGKVENLDLINSLNGLSGDLPSAENARDWTAYEFYAEEKPVTIAWYKDVTYEYLRYRAVYFTDYRPKRTELALGAENSDQYRNGYTSGKVYWFKFEPITWRMLYDDSGIALLMIDNAIDSTDYYNSQDDREIDRKVVYANNYEHSNVRAWLNSHFYDTAFDESEKEAIQLTEVDNSELSTNPFSDPYTYNNGLNPYACNSTEDKVFLASLRELTCDEYGFPKDVNSSPTRRFSATDYARAVGVSPYEKSPYDSNTYGWTRSPYYCYYFGMQRVDYTGEFKLSSNVRHASIAPVACINLST